MTAKLKGKLTGHYSDQTDGMRERLSILEVHQQAAYEHVNPDIAYLVNNRFEEGYTYPAIIPKNKIARN
jgi:hypothetical protein